MTNEEAIRVIKELWRYKDCGHSDKEVREALDMAIESLERSDKFQQKAEVVISQLRADRDQLLYAIADIKAEIESEPYVSKMEVLEIIDKHTKESEGTE